jgi:hypothetical protein
MTLGTELPAGVEESLAVLDGFDAALVGGFSRLTPAAVAVLEELAGAFAGTALGPPVAEAAVAIPQGELLTHHFVSLAAARASLMGAVADALLAGAAGTLGLSVGSLTTDAPPPPPPELTAPMEGARDWLVELALAGFGQLEPRAIAPAAATVQRVQETAGLERLAAVLTGFSDELMDHAPTAVLPALPARRWADLWSACLLLTQALPDPSEASPVEGSMAVVGCELQHHEHLAHAVVWGILDGRWVRARVSAWKVDAIAGAEVWGLLQAQSPVLMAAVASPAAVTVKGFLAPTGDLLVTSAEPGAPLDPFQLDFPTTLPALPPRDRHPIQLAIPVQACPDGLPRVRVGALSGFDTEATDAELGLLRWDGAWGFQPLLGRTSGKKAAWVGPPAMLGAAAKAKAPALDVLRERASKLLRAG